MFMVVECFFRGALEEDMRRRRLLKKKHKLSTNDVKMIAEMMGLKATEYVEEIKEPQ